METRHSKQIPIPHKGPRGSPVTDVLHALANLNIVRNWVGQSTSPDFYDMADKYGILLWDEFFQPNPFDGPDVDDIPTYIANVTDKVVRYRNHPSIAVWCARNEGYPPKALDDQLKALMQRNPCLTE